MQRRAGEHRKNSLQVRLSTALIITLLLIAWGFRIWNLNAQSLWNDEGYGVYLAHQDWPAMTWDDIVHPPLFTYLLHVWLEIGSAEWILRWLPAAFGMLTVAAIYAVGVRVVGKPAALIGALLGAVAPQLVYYSQEVRPHMAGVALGWLALAALVRVVGARIEQPGDTRALLKNSILYTLLTVLSCLTLYFSALLAVAGGLWALIVFLRGPGVVSQNDALMARRGGALERYLHSPWSCAWLLATAGALTPLMVWAVIAYQAILPVISIRGPVFGSKPSEPLDFINHTITGWIVGPATSFDPAQWSSQPVVLALLLLASAGLLASCRERTARVERLLLLPLVLVVPPCLLWLIDQRVPNFQPRYLMVAAPALYLLAASGAIVAGLPVASLARMALRNVQPNFAAVLRGAMLLAQAGLPVMLTFGILGLWSTPMQTLWFDSRYARDDYRGMVAAIATQAVPDDALVLDAYWQEGMVSYYTDRDDVRLPVYGFPTEYPLDEAKADQRLQDIITRHTGIWLMLYGQGSLDPDNFVEDWLNRHTQREDSRWYGEARLVHFSLPHSPLLPLNETVKLGPLTLAGLAVDPASADGRNASIRIAWQVNERLQDMPQISLRMIDAKNHIWAQSDYQLTLPDDAQNVAVPGQPFMDVPALAIPPGTPAGQYQLEVVVYSRSGQVGDAKPGTIEVKAPPALPDLSLLRSKLAAQIDRSFGSLLLLGTQRPIATRLKPGDSAVYDLLWLQQDPERSRGFVLQAELVDSHGIILAHTAQALQASSELLRVNGGLQVPEDADDGQVTLRLQVQDGSGHVVPAERVFYWNSWQEPLPLTIGGEPWLSLATIEIQGRQRSYTLPADIGVPHNERYGTGIQLVGIRTDTSKAGFVHLTLIWRSLGPVGGDYTVFTHLLDGQNKVIGQDDRIPLHGAAPTGSWKKGEILIDEYEIQAPGGQTYTLEIGWYDAKTGQRLQFMNANGRLAGDSYMVGPVSVK